MNENNCESCMYLNLCKRIRNVIATELNGVVYVKGIGCICLRNDANGQIAEKIIQAYYAGVSEENQRIQDRITEWLNK